MDTPTISPPPAALDPAAVVADIAGTAAASLPAPSAPATPPAPRPARRSDEILVRWDDGTERAYLDHGVQGELPHTPHDL